MEEIGLHILGVVQPAVNTPAIGYSHHQWHGQSAVGPIADSRRLSDELVGRGPDEVGELHLGDGPQPPEGGSQGNPHNRGLREGRVYHPLLAELLQESLGRQEDAPALSYILPHDEDARVPFHLLVHGLAHGLYHRFYSQRTTSSVRSTAYGA